MTRRSFSTLLPAVAATAALLLSLSAAAGEPIPLHEMEPLARLAAIMRLMDTGLGAETLGGYVKRARSDDALHTARNVVEMIAARASARRSDGEKRRILSFALVALESPDEAIRVKALECIRRNGRRGNADKVLTPLFAAESERVRRAALEAATSVAGRALLDPLAGVLFDERAGERERLTAVQALGGIPSDKTLAMLERAAGSLPDKIAVNAVTTAARIPMKYSPVLLLKSARDERPEVRLAAYRGLVDFRITRDFPRSQVRALLANQGGEKGRARLYLLRLLCACGEEGALPHVKKELETRDQRQLDTALLLEGLGMSRRPEAMPLVRKAAARHAGNEQLRIACYLAAGRIGTPEASAWLVEQVAREEGLSRAMERLYDALSLAGGIPADVILPLLTSPTKRPPRYLLPLAAAKGPLDAAGKTLAAFERVFSGIPSDRVAAGGLVLLARRGVAAARELVRGNECLRPLLEDPLGLEDTYPDPAWIVALCGTEDRDALSRLLAWRLENGRGTAPLAEACAWNRAALEVALGAWHDLPAETRNDCLRAIDLKFGLSLVWHLEGFPEEAAREYLSFLLDADPYRSRPPEAGKKETPEHGGRLVRVGATLRWEEEKGVLRTPVMLLSADIPNRARLVLRLLERGVMVLDEPFMKVDVVVVKEKDDPWPCKAAAKIDAARAAALVGIKE